MRFTLSVAALVTALVPALAAVAAPVTVPAGTPVTVQLVNPMSSSSAKVDQHFAFQVAAPVVVRSRVVVEKGASGAGRVVAVTKAHGKSAGQLTLEFTSVHSAAGTPIMLTQVPHKQYGNAQKGKASTATIAATVALGPLGLFAHNLVKGKDVAIAPSQTFPAWVKSNTPVDIP